MSGASVPAFPAIKTRSGPLFAVRGKGYIVGCWGILYGIFIRLICLAERIGGAALIPWITAPVLALDIFRRRRDYPQFVRLRTGLPAGFWRGLKSRQHYLTMGRSAYEMLGAVVLYHRLGSPHWQERFQLIGTPPQALPEWGKRPMILAFLHTGAFGLIGYWMRAQGVPTAALASGLPPVLNNSLYQKIIEAGDRRYGLVDVPHVFSRGGALKDAVRFLRPGHVLAMAMDGSRLSSDVDLHNADAFPIVVKNGACRIAAQTNAIVIPVAVRRTAVCCFEIHFGKPVPDELIQKKDFRSATQHLVSELWPQIEEHPVDLNWTTLEALAPALRGKRTEWP